MKRQYVDLDFDNVAKVTNLPTPSAAGDASNKAYVDPPVDNTSSLVGTDVKDVWKRLYWPTTVQVAEYSAGDLVSVTFYKDNTSVLNSNRLAKSTLTYSAGRPVSEAVQFFSLVDGTTVLKTITRTFTYTGNDVTKIEQVVT